MAQIIRQFELGDGTKDYPRTEYKVTLTYKISGNELVWSATAKGTDTSRQGTYKHYLDALAVIINGTPYYFSGWEGTYGNQLGYGSQSTYISYTITADELKTPLLNDGTTMKIYTRSSCNQGDPSEKTTSGYTLESWAYAPKQYTITYKPGSYATGDEYTDSANIGSNITLRGATYTRDNYTQKGWSTNINGTTKNYELSAQYALSDGTILYPYWEYNYVTVSYNPNGGTGTVDSQSVLRGSNVILKKNGFDAPPSTSPVHAIHLKDETGNADSNNGTATCYENKFYRWGLNSATGTSYKEEVSYGPVNDPTVFYAKWSTNYQLGSATKSPTEKTGYQVIFDVITNEGTCSTVVLNSKIYTHYDFAGWISVSSGTVYQPGAKVGGATSYTYKESWTPRTENGSIDLPAASKTDPSSTSTSITLNPNKGTCNIRSMQSTASITYTFAGWYNGDERVGGAGDKFTPDKATTLIAQFTSQTSNFNSITLPTPTRSGYKFLGWSTDPNAIVGTIGQYTPQGGETLYAIWRPNGTVRISYGPSKMETKAQIFIFKDEKWQMAQGWTFDNNWEINGG